ncbi:MAG: hypothetical protein JJE04_21235 [Acidobacteriia bacterium]|nr:hypothetical protein [Terriglobia bacterium]
MGAAVLAMGDDPFSGDIVKLEGEGERWRRRVGQRTGVVSYDFSTPQDPHDHPH